MLDGLLGRGFSSKCKSLIKLTRTRLDAIMRKRSAMQKYLKKDIADLLANGLDINAYGRADGFSVELSLSSCYDSAEHFCECILKHLSVMQKQKECPEECREAVSSLMFAAARFADLPELRDLRDIFTERYGKALEPFVNKQLVDNLASKPPTVEKKVQLMRDIAQEFSINWNSKAFEQKIANPLLPAQDPPKRRGSFNDRKIDDNKVYNRRNEMAEKRDNQDVSSSGRRTLSEDEDILQGNREETALDRDRLALPLRHGSSDDGYRLHSEGGQTIFEKNQDCMSHRGVELAGDRYKQHKVKDETIIKMDEFTDIGFKQHKGRDHTTSKRGNHVLPQQETNDGFKPHKSSDDTIMKRSTFDNLYHGRSKHDNGRELHNRTENTFHRRDKQDISSYKGEEYLTTKQKAKMDSGDETLFAGDNHKVQYNFTEKASKGPENVKPLPPPPYLKPNGGKYTARNVTSDCNNDPADVAANGRLERIQMDSDCVDDNGRNPVGLGSTYCDDKVDHPDDMGGDKKRKPRSVRRRHLKPPPGQEYRGSNEGDDSVKRYPNGRRRDGMRQGLQHVLEDGCSLKDEEERAMDKLLMHYSKKPSKFEQIKVREALNATPGHHNVTDANELQRHRKNGLAYPEPVPPPSRAVSLPPEPATPKETERVPTRATSFQPEMMNPGAHVHPRLPDYDDLAARFAALRGR